MFTERPRAAVDVHAGNLVQRVTDVLGGLIFDIFRRYDRGGLGGVEQTVFRAGADNDDFIPLSG